MYCCPRIHADALAFEVSDAVDALSREEFEAADVDAGEQDNRFAGIDCRDPIGRMRHAEIDLALGDRPSGISRPSIDIADLGKTLRAQQFLGQILRGVAQGMAVRQTDCRRFKRPLCGHSRRSAHEAGGAR